MKCLIFLRVKYKCTVLFLMLGPSRLQDYGVSPRFGEGYDTQRRDEGYNTQRRDDGYNTQRREPVVRDPLRELT